MIDAGQPGPRRVVVAIEASDAGQEVLENAARLAARLEAELVGLLIEDRAQQAAADLPVTQLVPSQARYTTAVDAAAMRRAYRVWSGNTRRRVATTAERWRVHWSCQSTQGPAVDQLLNLTRAGDLLAMTAPALGAAHALRAAACSVLVVQRCGTRARPVVVVYQGQEAILAAGLDLAQHYRGPLVILVLSESAEDAAALENQARAWLLARRERAEIVSLSAPEESELTTALEAPRPGTVVYARRSPYAPLLDRALERRACSTLVLC